MAETLLLQRFSHRRREAYWSLVLALGTSAALIVLASVMVLWDIRSFQKKVESFFQIDLDAPKLAGSRAQYAANSANTMTERLIRKEKDNLFSALPGSDGESPSLQLEATSALRPIPSHFADQPPEALRTDRNAMAALERKARWEASRNALPILGLRKVGTTPHRAGNTAFRPGGQAGPATLGVPGETLLQPKPLDMPPAPAIGSLQPTLPGATAFDRNERANLITHRLVLDRPAKGYPSMDEDIEARFAVYRAPGTQEVYFRLDLALRKESRLNEIDKDILFLIDISQSIGNRELARVREGVLDSLAALGQNDRWNVVLFSENTYWYDGEGTFLTPPTFNREAVGRFINKRANERRTNVFKATQVILERIPPSNRPCNVYLISDGKATESTTDVRHLVNDFQRVNRDNFSIFPLNAGPRGNLYLLSLLAYRSRGVLTDCPEADNAARTLRDLTARYEDPVVTNVVANYTNLNAQEVYPVVLPNLYRKSPVTFWGRADPGKKVLVRVAGLTEGGPREFFFETTVPKGDPSNQAIIREWARGKAHAMIAALGDTPDNNNLRQAILDLAAAHQLNDVKAMFQKKRFPFLP